MEKNKKIISLCLSLAIIIVICASIFIFLFYYINSVEIKDDIEKKIYATTGMHITIKGTPYFSIYPQLGLRLGEIKLEDTHNINNHLTVQSANVGIKFSSLLLGKVKSANIILYNLFYHFDDKYLIIDKLLIDGSNINLSKEFPLKIEGEISNKNFVLPTNFIVTTKAKIDIKNKKLYFNNVEFINKFILKTQTINILMTGDMLVDLNYKMISCNNFVAYSDGVLLQGKFNIYNFISQPIFNSSLDFKLVDPIKLLNFKNKDLQEIKNLHGRMDLTFLNKVKIKGFVSIDSVNLFDVKIQPLKAYFEVNGQEIKMTKFLARAYGGDLFGNAELILSDLPKITVHLYASRLQIKSFLADNHPLSQKIKLSGLANMEINISSNGYDLENLKNNINGSGYFKFIDGFFSNFTFTQLINSKYTAENKIPPLSYRNDYDLISGKCTLNSRIISCSDLTLETKEVRMQGKSIIDLYNYSLNYTLQTQIKDHITSQMGMNINAPVVIADINQTYFF